MLTEITNIKDVEAFARQLAGEGVSFHPDDDFNEYVFFEENRPCYSKEGADQRNILMDQCFKVCEEAGADIYSVMLDATMKETGMDKLIPLPHQLDPKSKP